MRLIDADTILKADENSDKALVLGSGKALEIAYALLKKKVADAPTVDAVPVVHGRWGTGRFNLETGNYEKQCTRCRNFSKEYGKPYCPNCGAMMDGGIVNGR